MNIKHFKWVVAERELPRQTKPLNVAAECPNTNGPAGNGTSSLVASEVEEQGVRDLQGLILHQDDVVRVQVRLLPLLHLRKKTNVTECVEDCATYVMHQ